MSRTTVEGREKNGVGREGRKGERGVFSQILSRTSRPLVPQLTLETAAAGL
jgi:hypothetical protein